MRNNSTTHYAIPTMPEETVRLTLHGLSSEDGHVRLVDFVKELQLLSGALKRFDRFISGRVSCYYRIVDLSHQSPATVVLEARAKKREDFGIPNAVVGGFISTIEHIQATAELPTLLDTSILRQLSKMIEPVGKSISRIEVGSNGRDVSLSPEFGKALQRIMAPEEEFQSAFSGMLEAINFHGGANVFYIYPDIGPTRIVCHFSKDLEAAAIAAVKRFVTVSGLFRRKTSAPHPHSAEITGIEVMPPEEELPSFRDLLGIAPDATGDLLSEDFVREVRHATTLR